MTIVEKIKAWNKDRTTQAKWDTRNYDNIAVFLDTFNHPYWNFQQDYFMEYTEELEASLEKIEFIIPPYYAIKNDPFNFFGTIFWNQKHNIVIRLVSPKNLETFKMALKIIKALKVVEDKISLTDVFVASIKCFNGETEN
jgi:hypothetical protein